MSMRSEQESRLGPPIYDGAQQLLPRTATPPPPANAEATLQHTAPAQADDASACGICFDQVASASCSGPEPHYLCDPCFSAYAKAEFVPGGAFEGKRTGGSEGIESEPGELPCYRFVTGECDCAAIPPTTVARILSTDAQALRLHDFAKRRLFAAEQEAARREAERRTREAKAARAAVDRLRAAAMEALSRGGFVACPRCGVHGQKNDACMHMRCPCGTAYCYCCGRERGGSSGCARRGCDALSPYLQDNTGWGAFALDGESEGMGALHEFHRQRMAYFLRRLKEAHPANQWRALRRAYPDLLDDVPTPGRRIGWDEIDGAVPPVFGRTEPNQLRWAEEERYRIGNFTRGIIAKGKEGSGRNIQDGYKLGDFTRGILARGKEKSGRNIQDGYKFGDFTRGLLG